MKGFAFWDKLQAAEAQVVARVRAVVFLIAGGSLAFTQGIDQPTWVRPTGNVVFVVCGALALLMRAGEKNPKPDADAGK